MQRDLEKTLSKIINSISIIGVLIYQEKGKIVFSNRALANMLGYTQEEMLKLSIFDILYTQDETTIETIEKRLKGEKFAKEYRELLYKTKTGFIKPTLNFGYTINFKGKPSGLILVIDITTQRTYSLLYESLAKITITATEAKTEDKLIKKTSEILTNTAKFDLVAIGKIDKKTKMFKPISVKARRKKDKEIFKNIKISVDENIPEGKGSTGEAYRSKSIVIINNVYEDERMSAWREVQKKTGVYAVCSFPILKKDQIEYMVILYSRIPEVFKNEFLDLIKNIQRVLSAAIERIETEKWKNILNQAVELGFDIIIITDEYFNILYSNKNAERVLSSSKEKLTGKNFLSLIKNENSINMLTLQKNTYNVLSIKTKKDKEIKVLLNISPVKLALEEELVLISGKDITNNIELQKTLERTLNIDQITGLINRQAFIKSIEKFIKRARHRNLIGAVVIINPVDFSTVNKALGFKKANEILIEISKRIMNFLRGYDVVAKLESDRFGVLIKDIQREEDIFVIVKRMLDTLAKPYYINGSNLTIGFTAGISLFPFDSEDPEELIEKAEIALPEEKEKAVNFGFYKDSLRDKFKKRIEIELSFFKAINNNEFVFFFQPYVDASNLKISGAESLIRWQKNSKIIPPMDFIPYLEELKLIKGLEYWIINKKLKCLKEIISLDIPVALNLSSLSLNDDIFVERLISKVKNEKIQPQMLRIEITERLAIDNLEKAINTMKKLRKEGIGVMIDDFGTGYSSLSYLSKLPVDFIKIDISFIKNMLKDPKTLSIVKTIIFMAKELNIKTIAEGVETEEQIKTLQDIGCDYMQGFYFFKPTPKHKLKEIVNKNN